MRRIAVVTSGRWDWGYLRPVCRAIDDHPGLRLLRWDVPAVGGNTGADMARNLAAHLGEAVSCLELLGPDILVVLGDRGEMFAAALAAGYLGIPVAHIHAGDVSNNGMDDVCRDSISRLAAIRFAASDQAYWHIDSKRWGKCVLTGSPSLDELEQLAAGPPTDVPEILDPFGVLLMHGHLGLSERGQRNLAGLAVSAMQDSPQPHWFWIAGNPDAGGQVIHDILAKHFQRGPDCQSLPRDQYAWLLKHTEVMVTNSSSARIEAGTLGTQVIEVGTRQGNRSRGPYHFGFSASEKIVDELASMELTCERTASPAAV